MESLNVSSTVGAWYGASSTGMINVSEPRFTVNVIISFFVPTESLLNTTSLEGSTPSMAIIWSPALRPALSAGEYLITFVIK